jgi:hypothetical protein
MVTAFSRELRHERFATADAIGRCSRGHCPNETGAAAVDKVFRDFGEPLAGGSTPLHTENT